MDKLLIAVGATLIWLAYQDEQQKLIDTVTTPGFAGTMAIMGGLLAVHQYAPKAGKGYAAASAALIALGLWNSYYSSAPTRSTDLAGADNP